MKSVKSFALITALAAALSLTAAGCGGDEGGSCGCGGGCHDDEGGCCCH